MSELNLDSYRAMAGGKYNLGAVVVKTDAATGELKLAKVNNSQRGRKVEVPAAESKQARSLLFSLMSADLGEVFGRGAQGLSEFLKDLRAVLFGKNGDRAEAELTRAKDGDLAQAFNLFDAFKAKKLSERTAALSVKTAERDLVLTTAKFDAGFKNARAEAKQNLQSLERTISDKVKTDVSTLEQKIDDWKKAESAKINKVRTDAEKKGDGAVLDEAKARMAILKDVFGRPTSAAEDIARCKAKIAHETAGKDAAQQQLKAAETELKAGLAAIQTSRRDLQDAVRYLQSTVLKGRSGAVDGKAYDTLRTAYGLNVSAKSFARVLTTRQEAVEKIAFTLRRDDASLTPLNAVVKAVDLLRADERALEKAGKHAPQPSLAGRWTAVGERTWEALAAPAAAAAREQAKETLETIAARQEALTRKLDELQARVDHPAEGKAAAVQQLESQLGRLEDKLADATGTRKAWIQKLGRELTGLKNEFAEACAKSEIWDEVQNPAKEGDKAPGPFDAWRKSIADQYGAAKDALAVAEAEKKAWDALRQNVLGGAQGQVGDVPRGTDATEAAFQALKQAKDASDAAKAGLVDKGRYHDTHAAGYWQTTETVVKAYGEMLADLQEDAAAFKTAARAAGVKISEQSFRRIFEGRAEAVKQTALALLADGGTKLDVDAALVKAVRTLRDAEKTAARHTGAPASLDKTEKAFVDFLRTMQTGADVKNFLSRQPAFRNCVSNELQGGFRLLAMAPNTDQSVTLSIPLSANRKKTGVITLMQGADNALSINYKGHTFVLGADAKTLHAAIQETKIVPPQDKAAYDSYNPESADTVDEQKRLKVEHENWQENLLEGQCLDQKKIVGKIDEMLEKLRTLNNARPGVYGGAPHFDNKMPMLDADGARQHRVPFLDFNLKRLNFSGVRPETFLRTVYNKEIEKSGPVMGGLIKLWAKMIDVPLEAGSRDGTGNTVFEKAARYLHGIRLLAQNANYILSRLNMDLQASGLERFSKAERKLCQEACDEFGRITQFTVHPSFGGEEYTGRQIAMNIRDSLLMHCRVFDQIGKLNSDEDFELFFKTIASGACFNDCMSNMDSLRDAFNIVDISPDEYLVKAAPDDVAQPVAEQPAPAEEAAEPEAAEPAPAGELQQAFEARKAAGLPAISPAKDETLHRGNGESLDAYLKNEIAGIYQSINDSVSASPKAFSWKEVKTFLKERMDKVNTDLCEKAAADAKDGLASALRQKISGAQGTINTLYRDAAKADQWFNFLFNHESKMDTGTKIKNLKKENPLQALLKEFCGRADARAFIRAGQKDRLVAAFKDYFGARIAALQQTVDAAKRELADLQNLKYAQDKMEAARRSGGLKLYFAEESVEELSEKNPDLYKRLVFEDAPKMRGFKNLRYDSEGFWELVEQVMDEEKLVKKDNALEFAYGALVPSLVEPKAGDREGKIYTMIRAVSASGVKGEPVVYDSAVQGDVTNFVKTVDEKGSPVWRTRDGRYEIVNAQEVVDSSFASFTGDVAYQAGDVRIPNNI